MYLQSSIFNSYKDIVFGFSTKIGSNSTPPYHFNMSLSVGDYKEKVYHNRMTFIEDLGLKLDNVAFQKQIHSDIITYVDKAGTHGESDALITDKLNLGLAISTADCTPLFIYDKKNKVIAAIHSGWKGTQQKIVTKTIQRLRNEFNSSSDELIVYMGPSIAQCNYEVGPEFQDIFHKNFILKNNDKYFLDVAGANYLMLLEEGVLKNNIQKSNLCSYEFNSFLHSYRREGLHSGRAIGVIAMRNYGQ